MFISHGDDACENDKESRGNYSECICARKSSRLIAAPFTAALRLIGEGHAVIFDRGPNRESHSSRIELEGKPWTFKSSPPTYPPGTKSLPNQGPPWTSMQHTKPAERQGTKPATPKGMWPAERRDTKTAAMIGTRRATIRATTKVTKRV